MQQLTVDLAGPRARFLTRARAEALALKNERPALATEGLAGAIERITAIAHRLAGGGGTVGYDEISDKAFALEQFAIATSEGADTIESVERALDELVVVIGRA